MVRFSHKQMRLNTPSAASHTLETPQGQEEQKPAWGWQVGQSVQKDKLAQQEKEKKKIFKSNLVEFAQQMFLPE